MQKQNWPNILNTLFAAGKLTELGRSYCLEVTSSPPSRNPVNANGGNLIVDVASWKMRHTMQVESLSVEAACAQGYESDDCLGFFPQPMKLKIKCTDRNGVARLTDLTFDFLVIYRDRVELVECKKADELKSLSQTWPGRYKVRPDGSWSGEEVINGLIPYGINFKIVSSDDINLTKVRNDTLLAEIRQSEYSRPDSLTAIRQKFSDHIRSLTLKELIDGIEERYTKNDIYFALRKRDLFFPEESALLAHAETTPICAKKEYLEEYKKNFRHFIVQKYRQLKSHMAWAFS